MELLSIFLLAAVPVLKLLLVTALGSFLALERIDILGEEARRHLNNVIYFVFSPALVASCLVETITLESLATLWFMPVNVLLTFIAGSILALILNKVAGTPQHLRGLVIGSCAAGNLGFLLLIIVPAVCNEPNSPFGNPAICEKNGIAYSSLSMAFSIIYIWSYVYVIMRISIRRSVTASFKSTGESSDFLTGCSTDPLLPSTVCKDRSFLQRVGQMLKKLRGEINLKMMFAPSTTAAFVGLLIAVVSPIRNAMVGDGAVLHVIDSSTYLVGQAFVPTATLVLGANLLRGLKVPGVGLGVILGIVVIRFVALPIIGIGIVKGAHYLGLVGPDHLYQFVLMLQYAVPPAVAIGTITQLFEAGQNECSVVMLWTYALSAFLLTLWSAILMWIVAW